MGEAGQLSTSVEGGRTNKEWICSLQQRRNNEKEAEEAENLEKAPSSFTREQESARCPVSALSGNSGLKKIRSYLPDLWRP